MDVISRIPFEDDNSSDTESDISDSNSSCQAPPYSPLQSELEFSASSSEEEVETEDVSEEETEIIKQPQQSTNDK